MAISTLAQSGTPVGRAARLASRITAERILWIVMVAVVFGIAIVPLLYVVNAAFHGETPVGLSQERTLAALIEVYSSGLYLSSLMEALVLAAIVTLLSLTYGVILAFLIARTDVPGRRLL